MKKYYIQEQENSKYFKDVPYLTKKQFKPYKNEYKIIGSTLLKKTDRDNSVLHFNDENYVYKDNIIGKTKGYIILEDGECVILKRHIPFLFLLFILLLMFIIFLLLSHKKESIPSENITPPVEQIEKMDIEIEEQQYPETIIAKEYSISYELHGGYLEKDNPLSYIQGETKELSSPIKEGYKFIGWFYNGKQIKYIDSNTKGNLILHAQWKPIQYIINYHSNYDNDIIKKHYYKYDEESNYIVNLYDRKGYTFLGWYKSNEINTLYQSQDKFINLSNQNNQEIDLYAKWQMNEYNVVFKDYDDSLIMDIKLPYQSEINYPENPIRKGYIFSGWDNNISKIEENTIIKANYEIVDYKINYELNDGKMKDPISNFNIESDDITLPIPQRKGYSFEGWSEEKNKPNVNFVIPKGSIGDKILTANWKANKYLVKFNPNGGKLDIDSLHIEYNQAYGNLPIPIKDGYIFEGWLDNKEKITSDSIFNKTSDSELFADWQVTDY